MACSTRAPLTKQNRSEEHFRKIWISLFDIKILSSCNEKDFDLFCASALLKTAFYHIISIKKRLCDAGRLLESQELELKALKLENDKYNSEFKCEKCVICMHCQEIDGNISSERTSKTLGGISEKEVPRKRGWRGHSERTKAEDGDVREAGEIAERMPPTTAGDKLSEEATLLDSANSVLREENSREEKVGKEKAVRSEAGREADRSGDLRASAIASTPKKRPVNVSEAAIKKSPVLKRSKRPKASPGKRRQKQISEGTKSPSLLPSEGAFGATREARGISESGAFHPGKNTEESLGLKSKPLFSPAKFLVSDVDSPDREAFTKADSLEGDSAEEDIIMPSPSNSGNNNREAIRKSAETKEDRKKGSRYPDTDVTYFFPKEESSDGGCSEERMDCEGITGGGKEPLGNSFDRIPTVEDLPFKYRRDAVRKRTERMKLRGWDCRECQKYYEAAGHGSDYAEKRTHLNLCSRHRDRFSPEKNTPKGFWDPVFPETPR